MSLNIIINLAWFVDGGGGGGRAGTPPMEKKDIVCV